MVTVGVTKFCLQPNEMSRVLSGTEDGGTEDGETDMANTQTWNAISPVSRGTSQRHNRGSHQPQRSFRSIRPCRRTYETSRSHSRAQHRGGTSRFLADLCHTSALKCKVKNMHLLPPLRAKDSRMPRRCHERVRVVKHARATCCPVRAKRRQSS